MPSSKAAKKTPPEPTVACWFSVSCSGYGEPVTIKLIDGSYNTVGELSMSVEDVSSVLLWLEAGRAVALGKLPSCVVN